MRRATRGGEEEGTTRAITGSVAAADGSSAGATCAAGGASCKATAGVAEDSAASMWQQDDAPFRTVLPEPSGPWQQPVEEAGAPGRATPRWQKQSPAEASSNATASTATPSVLRN